jgi:hypothetical protein
MKNLLGLSTEVSDKPLHSYLNTTFTACLFQAVHAGTVQVEVLSNFSILNDLYIVDRLARKPHYGFEWVCQL